MLYFFSFGLLIFFIGNKKLINFFRTAFFLMSTLSIFYSLLMTGQRILIRIVRQGAPRLDRTIKHANWNSLSDECLYELSGFFLNVITMVVMGVCGWEKPEVGEKKDDEDEAWSFKFYLNHFQRVFWCLSISVFVSLAATSATVMVKIISPVIPPHEFDVFEYSISPEKLIWIILLTIIVLAGLFNCVGLPSRCYKTKKNDVADKSSVDKSTA